MKIKWKGGGKVKIWSVGLVMLLVILTATTASAQSVTLKPSTTEPLVNGTFTVDVVVSDVGSIIGLKANISYTDNLEYLGVDDYRSGWIKLSDDPIRVFTTDSNNTVDTTNGATIVKLKFKALSEGNATITLSSIKVKDVDDKVHNLDDVNTTVMVKKIINITAIKVEVEPTVVTWGYYNDITVRVTTPEGYPVRGANVTLMGVNTKHTYATGSTNESGVAVFTILPSPSDTEIEVNVTYWNGTALLVNKTYISVVGPVNITYVYATARIENTTTVLANKEIKIYYSKDINRVKETPYGTDRTDSKGEFLIRLPAVKEPGQKEDYYIWIEPIPKSESKGWYGYVNVTYDTKVPGHVEVVYGTTSMQANVPVRATVRVVYPDNLVVQVFNDLSGVWSNDRTCCKECIDTPPKKADGVSKFKVKATLYANGQEYNLTDLENALAQLGINALPDYVRVCVNDTNIAVMDTNGQMCDSITFTYKHNSTAIFYVRSNAPTDPSELTAANTGIVSITGWYNYTIDRNVIPVNVPRVPEVNLTDYDCADFEGTGFIAGEVVDSQTKHSIAGAKVYVKWFNGTAWVNATNFEGNQIVTTSDEHGHYKLEVISGRTYKVYAEKEGYKGCAPSQEVYVQLGTTTTADVVLVKNSITKPDLTVESIDVGTPVVNETVTVKAKIANVGDADAKAFNVSLYADGSPIDTKTVESLAAKANITVEFSWTPDEAKTYELKVVADVDKAVDESNEENNEMVRSVTVTEKPDVLPWTTWEDDGVISDDEIQEAVYYWKTNTPVNGHTITDEEIQTLVYWWKIGHVEV